jgi:hypothetical protein
MATADAIAGPQAQLPVSVRDNLEDPAAEVLGGVAAGDDVALADDDVEADRPGRVPLTLLDAAADEPPLAALHELPNHHLDLGVRHHAPPLAPAGLLSAGCQRRRALSLATTEGTRSPN